jgi:hypothetical protein
MGKKMQRDTKIENDIMNKMAEWKMEGNNLFDFPLPDKIEIEINPRRGGEDGVATGRCRVSASKIWLCYCNDMAENLHVLLHEMCHLNRNAYHHDKVYNRSLAYATERITGVRLDPSKPMRKLDTEVAVAFGATSRNAIIKENESWKVKREKELREHSISNYQIGDYVEYAFKETNGYCSWDEYALGKIIKINPCSARCHIKNMDTGEVCTRKINKIRKVRLPNL